MTLRTRIAQVLAARDPGHVRFVTAAAVSAGVLASVLLGWAIVHTFHADVALLSMSVFLSMQAGNMVKDQTAAARLVTTTLLIPALASIILLAAVASVVRPLAIAGFILMTGVAIWVRRFGHRAAALGATSFIGYFFTLFMKPNADDLDAFVLIAVGAIVSQVVVRALLLVKRPRRELEVMLQELRAASLAAIHAATDYEHPRRLRSSLARADEVGRAVTHWQERFRTEKYIDCSADTLEMRVLDARVDIEEASYELAKASAKAKKAAGSAIALEEVIETLAKKASPSRMAAARIWASRVVDNAQDTNDGQERADTSDYLLARAVLAHERLRSIDLTRELTPALTNAQPKASPEPSKSIDSAREAHPRLTWKAWRDWSPSSRMTVQAMIAATLASVAGEAISASRWYWAVMTAFVIFMGTTTRSGILTRAVRRVAGTLAGIGIGVIAMVLVGDSTWATALIAVIAVFGMLYLGPLNYVYLAMFVTTMLVAIYHMLGILDPQLLELRLAETIAGAVIGVLCAYLILSASSRPALLAQARSYFDSFDGLFHAMTNALSGAGQPVAIIEALHDLESRQADIDSSVAATSTAYMFNSSKHETESVHLMYIATRSAARLAQSTMTVIDETLVTDPQPPLVRDLIESIDEVRATLEAARGVFEAGDSSVLLQSRHTQILLRLQDPSVRAGSPEEAGVKALARIDWVLRRVVAEVEPGVSSSKA